MKNIRLTKGNTIFYILFFFFTIPCVANFQINHKPNLTLISTKAFFANYFQNNGKLDGRGAFAPFKEVFNIKGKYKYEFYDNYILQRTSPVVTAYFIQKVEKYLNRTIYYVNDSFGKDFIFNYEILQSGNKYLDILEYDKLNSYRCLTKYECEVSKK